MNLRPLGDRILVKVHRTENVSKGGIILTGAIKEKQKEGVVVSLGKKKEGDFSVREGDKVIFGIHAGSEVKTLSDDDQYLIMKEDELLAVIG